jgi:hypothetical protein
MPFHEPRIGMLARTFQRDRQFRANVPALQHDGAVGEQRRLGYVLPAAGSRPLPDSPAWHGRCPILAEDRDRGKRRVIWRLNDRI